jgi:cytochrome c
MKKQEQGKTLLTRAGIAAFVLVASVTFASGANAAGDPALGEKVFKKCKTCHMIGDGAKSKQGPLLTGIVDRPAGTIEKFRYSKALKTKAAEGLVWNEANLAEYLKAPRKFIPKGKMAFAGLRKEKDVANLLAYLKTFQ